MKTIRFTDETDRIKLEEGHRIIIFSGLEPVR